MNIFVFSETFKAPTFKKLLKFRKKEWIAFSVVIACSAIFAFLFCLGVYVFALCSDLFAFVPESMPDVIIPQSQTLSAQNYIGATLMSICAMLSIAVWFIVPKALRFWFGFFCGVFLFYWIGLSFRYSPLPFVGLFVPLCIGLVYGVLIFFALYYESKLYRLITLVLMSFIHPFGFDWFIPPALLSYSFFGVSWWHFVCLECAIALFLVRSSKFFMLLGLVLFVCSIDSTTFQIHKTDDFLTQKTQIIQTNLPQDLKWNQQSLNLIVTNVLSQIDKAIRESSAMIIFPETMLPFVLNADSAYSRTILEILKDKSSHIAIVIGSFSQQEDRIYNSTYVLYRHQVQILNKVVLAPFGEKIPLPDFLAKPLYRIFFGMEDSLFFASEPQDFELFGYTFRNAICYEGTTSKIYAPRTTPAQDASKNIDSAKATTSAESTIQQNNSAQSTPARNVDSTQPTHSPHSPHSPQFVVMISNNGWFAPSIESHLQRMLLKYYARLNHSFILHSTNRSESGIITPYLFGDMPTTYTLSPFSPSQAHASQNTNSHKGF